MLILASVLPVVKTMATNKQSLYQQVLESRIFDTQAEAIGWGNEQKERYKSADMSVKVDTNPVDATRRRWKTVVFLKT